MIVEAIHRIVAHRESLSEEEAREVMAEILSGAAGQVEVGALLVALHMRGESVDEIVGFARAMRAAAVALPVHRDSSLNVSGTERDSLIDTCGTGGDVSGTFNISTAAALIVAGGGVRVAKHGTRSISSKCGSADVVEALGVKFDLSADQLAQCLEQVGIVFLYAPLMHTAMKHVHPVRRALKMRTVFNLLGPLTNPAGASAQVVGVYSRDVVAKLAEALCRLGLQRALVVHGSDGLDEITLSGSTFVAEVRHGVVREFEIVPEQFGMARAPLETISGGDAQQNAQIIRGILQGEPSPRRDIALLNAAAALVAAGRADSIAEALPVAIESLDSGAARKKLEELVAFTNR